MSPPREARFHVCCINLGTGSGNTISLFGLFTFSFLSFLIYPILFEFHKRGVYTWGRDNSDCTWASSFTTVSALAPLAEAKASLCPDSLDFGPSRRLRIWPSLRRILIYTENRVSPGQMRRERTRIRMSSNGISSGYARTDGNSFFGCYPVTYIISFVSTSISYSEPFWFVQCYVMTLLKHHSSHFSLPFLAISSTLGSSPPRDPAVSRHL